jgi:hypothetical protein
VVQRPSDSDGFRVAEVQSVHTPAPIKHGHAARTTATSFISWLAFQQALMSYYAGDLVPGAVTFAG